LERPAAAPRFVLGFSNRRPPGLGVDSPGVRRLDLGTLTGGRQL